MDIKPMMMIWELIKYFDRSWGPHMHMVAWFSNAYNSQFQQPGVLVQKVQMLLNSIEEKTIPN